MSDRWVLAPLPDDELLAIRQELEDGKIAGPQKYAVIQRLIEGHLQANKQSRDYADTAAKYAARVDEHYKLARSPL